MAGTLWRNLVCPCPWTRAWHKYYQAPPCNKWKSPPKHTEIVKAIKQLKRKAVGPDGIPPEIFVACPNTMATLLEPPIKTRTLPRRMEKWLYHQATKTGWLERLQELERRNATEHHQQTGHHYFVSATNWKARATIDERVSWLLDPTGPALTKLTHCEQWSNNPSNIAHHTTWYSFTSKEPLTL